MTKTSARQKLAMELKRRMHNLLYDPQGVASKKVKKEEKQEEQDTLDRAAQEFENRKKIEEGIYTVRDMDEEELEECRLCLLPGCGLKAEDGKKYCSKRHYHAHQHKLKQKKNSEDTDLAEGVVWGLTFASQVLPSEGYKITAIMEYIPSEFYLAIKLDQVIGFVFMLTLGMIFAYHMGKRAGHREGQQLHHGRAQVQGLVDNHVQTGSESESEDSSTDEEPAQLPRVEQLPEAEDDPGIRPDVRRLTAPEIRHLVAYGFEVLSDQEVNDIRERFMATLQPSIEDYMSAEQIQKVLNGDLDAPEVPIEPAEWHGIGRVQREAMVRALEDSLLLGIPYEAMNGQLAHEAQIIRAELLTIRTVGCEIQRLSRH
jgi:hypothetical protein